MPPIIAAPNAPGIAAAPRVPIVTQTALVRLVLLGYGALDRARQLIAGQQQAQSGTPVPPLVNDAAARLAATKDALIHARREADDDAVALGLRVARVVAVSNDAGLGDGLDVLAQEFRNLGDRNKEPDTVVPRATAAVDHALVPLR